MQLSDKDINGWLCDPRGGGGKDVQLLETGSKGLDVARAGGSRANARYQAFEVTDFPEGVTHIGARQAGRTECSNSLLTLSDATNGQEWRIQPASKEPPTHRCARLVNHREERLALCLIEEACGELKVSTRGCIESHRVIKRPDGKRANMRNRALLGFLYIVEQGCRGFDAGAVVITAKTTERCHTKMAEQIFPWGLWKLSCRDACQGCGAASGDGIRESILIFGNQTLCGCDASDFCCDVSFCCASGKLTDQEFASRDIHNADASNWRPQNGRDKKIVRTGIEERILDEGAWGDNACDGSADQTFGLFWIFDLVANGDFIPLLDEACEIAVEGMIRNTCHRETLIHAIDIPARQRDIQCSSY